jgi:hypothetical protein
MTLAELHRKLAKTEPNALAAFLVRLAEEDPALRARIETLAQQKEPAPLAGSLERRLKRFRSGRAFISYHESSDFACELGAWLDDVEALILPADPETAWKLADAFIRLDEDVLDRADDSNGSIGAVFVRACGTWLRAAAALPADRDWVEQLHALQSEKDYGTRDALLDQAATLLSEPELRRLAKCYEEEARSAARDGEDEDWRGLSASTAMGQIARALKDAALYERSVRIRSPRPNELQAADIAQQYVEFGPVERAVKWLTRFGDTGLDETVLERLDLLAQAYEKIGNRDALLAVRRRIAERWLIPEQFLAYVALLPEQERAGVREHAIERAEQSADPVSAGAFLVALGAADRGAALIVHAHARLRAAFYKPLAQLARDLEKEDQPLAAVACYRALVDQILEGGRTAAYHYAKRYVDRLDALHEQVFYYRDLPPHAEYVAHLETAHRRKHSFWRLFQEPAPRRGRQQVP